MRAHSQALRIAVVAAFALLLTVGPLGLLQVVAWTGMALDYSARYGLADGLQRTFDGKHPCKLCTKISQVRQERPEGQATVTLPPVKFVCVAAASLSAPEPFLSRGTQKFHQPAPCRVLRTEAPPSPPPRALAA